MEHWGTNIPNFCHLHLSTWICAEMGKRYNQFTSCECFFLLLIKRLALTSTHFLFRLLYLYFPFSPLSHKGGISNQISAKHGGGSAEKRHSLKIWYRVFWNDCGKKRKEKKRYPCYFARLLPLPPPPSPLPPLSNLHFLYLGHKEVCI